MPRFWSIITGCLFAVLLSLGNEARADESVPAAEAKLELGLTVIVASSGEAFVDERIRDTARKLSSLFPYTRYERRSLTLETKVLNEAFRVTLPGGREFVATALSRTPDGQIKLSVEIADLLKTELRLKDGGTVILGGPQVENGVLVLVLSAQNLPAPVKALPKKETAP